MESELWLQMYQQFLKRSRWTLIGWLVGGNVIAFLLKQPAPMSTYYASFLMFIHLFIFMGVKLILKVANQTTLKSIQIVVTMLMAILMRNNVAGLCMMIGLMPVLVVEDIALSPQRSRYFFSRLTWTYASGVALLGMVWCGLSGEWISEVYIVESILGSLFLTYFMYKPVYDTKYKTLQLSQVNEELNHAYQKVALLTAVEERQKMARNLHDTLTQDLVGIGMQLAIVGTYMDNQKLDKARQQLHDVQKMTSDAVNESRTIIQQYRQITEESAEVSLKTRVLEQTELLKMKYGLETEIEIDDEIRLSGELLVDLVRIIREALMNVIKHANVLEACKRHP